MNKISVAIATYNEEKNIGSCLESIRQLANEIVIVDGSSKDNTRTIAKEFGAKIIKTSNKPMFHTNKNMAIDACGGDWILQLDADERVTPELAVEIKKAIRKPRESSPDAYWIKRRNLFLGRFLKKGGQYPDKVIRLFRKGKARLPEKSVHEQMMVEGKVGELKSDLLHFGTPDLKRYFLRENRYATLEALNMLERKVPVNPLTTIIYIIVVPAKTFFSIFVRHAGFLDGWRGFLFAKFSGFHHAWAYLKLVRMKMKGKIDIEREWK